MDKASKYIKITSDKWPTLAFLPIPVKVLLSSILITMSIGMIGALGQVIIHDIIPTFFSNQKKHETNQNSQIEHNITQSMTTSSRGDLFSEETMIHDKNEAKTEIDNDQLIWTLKWTHIHLFGMSMIFIFLGAVTVFLDMSVKSKSLLVALPFVGIVIDISAMWLKVLVSPAFFWLHIPGGGLFSIIFTFVFFKAMIEMWFKESHSPKKGG